MQAVQFSEYGGPEVLRVDDAPEPHAGPGQVRVAVRAAGVNPLDWKVRSGMLGQDGPLPVIPGYEAAGVVDEVGEDVTGVEIGDEVFGVTAGGAAAQYAVLAGWARKPADMDWAQAGGLGVAVETTGRVLALLGAQPGQTILINGAAGGVGTAAVQIARGRGLEVIGTAGEGNQEFLRSLGATPTLYGDGLVERVRAIRPEGVDIAFDVAGKGALPALVELAGGPDDVVTIADFSAAEHGVRVTTGGGERSFETLAEAADLFDAGYFTLPVAQTFPFAQAGEAQRISQDGHVRGKLVLVHG